PDSNPLRIGASNGLAPPVSVSSLAARQIPAHLVGARRSLSFFLHEESDVRAGLSFQAVSHGLQQGLPSAAQSGRGIHDEGRRHTACPSRSEPAPLPHPPISATLGDVDDSGRSWASLPADGTRLLAAYATRQGEAGKGRARKVPPPRDRWCTSP